MNNTIYCQWYPYRFKSGYYIVNPTVSELEDFYEHVAASDPNHESFVITMTTPALLNMGTINEYIKTNVLRIFFDRR